MRRKRRRTEDFILSGVTMGVGAHVLGQTDPTGQAAGAQTAVGKLSSFMPMTGTIVGAGWAMDELKGLHRKKKR